MTTARITIAANDDNDSIMFHIDQYMSKYPDSNEYRETRMIPDPLCRVYH